MPEIDLVDMINSSTDNRPLLDLIRSAPMPDLNGLPRCCRTASAIGQLFRTRSKLKPILEAGLWLLAGDLDRSHSISQSLNTQEGSLWHAMMHRREGDYSNAKYWYRQAKGHSVYARLAEKIGQTIRQSPEFFVGNSKPKEWTNPSLISEVLVDYVEQAMGNQNDWQLPLQRVCWWEWQLTFHHCWQMQQESLASIDFQN